MINPLIAVKLKPFEIEMYIRPATAHPKTISWYLPFERSEYRILCFGSRNPESTYSPSSGRINHVNTKVNQYDIRHEISMTRSGSHMPLADSSSTRALEARSTGTRRRMLAGRARARKIGTIR